MLDLYRQTTGNQYEAAFCTLNSCLQNCPANHWKMKIGNYEISQVVFHTLIFADLYLGADIDSMKAQPFHEQHAETFSDYEEFEYRPPVRLYDRAFLSTYLQHCRQKATSVLETETPESLHKSVQFPWLSIARAEMHVYNIRHIQHHAAQVILRMRSELSIDTPWFKSGWTS